MGVLRRLRYWRRWKADLRTESASDIPDIIARWRNREAETERKRTEKSFMVPKSEIEANGYDRWLNGMRRFAASLGLGKPT